MSRQSVYPESDSRHVSIVALPDAAVSTLTGVFDVMNGIAMMGALNTGAAAPSPFQIEIVGEDISGVNWHFNHKKETFASRGQKLILVGDLIHVAAVQLEHPQVTISFDSDPKAAAAERRQAFDAAARAGYLVGAAHLQFPGIGHLVKQSKGYDFIPANYTQMR